MKRIQILLIVCFTIAVFVLPRSNDASAQCGYGGGYVCGTFKRIETPTGHIYDFFTPYGGTEWAVDPLLTDASGQQINIDSLIGRSVRIWMPDFNPTACDFPNLECLTSIAGYEIVPSCEPIVNFSTEREMISAGECTILHWSVDNVSGFDGVMLDDECVPPEGSKEVCPLSDTTYTLRLSPYFGEIVKRITLHVSMPTPSPVPTPVPTPTPLPTPASPLLEVTGFKVEPAQVSVYEMVRITMIVENKGTPLNQPYWGYRGEVILEDGNGNTVERHSFAKGDASFISPVIENGQVNFEKWLLTVKVRFRTAVSNGKVIVSIQPDGQQSVLKGEGALIVNVGISGLTCTSVVVNKLVGPFSSETQKDLLDTISAELQALGCKDGDFACAAPPLVKGLVKVLGRLILGSIRKIIMGIWGVFDTDALQVCSDPVNWMWQLVREFNRQGVPISVSGSHSPVLILVTNSAGQRAGFVSDDEIVTELPDSRVIEWEGDRYVIYPADSSVIISLKGTGNGTASLTLIDSYSRSEASFSDIPVSDGSNFQLDLSNQRFELLIDSNGDGNFDGVQLPKSVEELRPVETSTPSGAPETPPPSVNQPTGICGGALGLIMIPVLTILATRRFRKITD